MSNTGFLNKLSDYALNAPRATRDRIASLFSLVKRSEHSPAPPDSN